MATKMKCRKCGNEYTHSKRYFQISHGVVGGLCRVCSRARSNAGAKKYQARKRAEKAAMYPSYFPTVEEAHAMLDTRSIRPGEMSQILPDMPLGEAKEIYRICLDDMQVKPTARVRKNNWRLVHNILTDFGGVSHE